jgi:hypothetical protein
MQMATSTWVVSRGDNFMERGATYLRVGKNILVNIAMGKSMEKGSIQIRRAECLRECGRWGRGVARGGFTIRRRQLSGIGSMIRWLKRANRESKVRNLYTILNIIHISPNYHTSLKYHTKIKDP